MFEITGGELEFGQVLHVFYSTKRYIKTLIKLMSTKLIDTAASNLTTNSRYFKSDLVFFNILNFLWISWLDVIKIKRIFSILRSGMTSFARWVVFSSQVHNSAGQFSNFFTLIVYVHVGKKL